MPAYSVWQFGKTKACGQFRNCYKRGFATSILSMLKTVAPDPESRVIKMRIFRHLYPSKSKCQMVMKDLMELGVGKAMRAMDSFRSSSNRLKKKSNSCGAILEQEKLRFGFSNMTLDGPSHAIESGCGRSSVISRRKVWGNRRSPSNI